MRTKRVNAIVILMACFLLAHSADAQQAGVVEGRVVNGTDPSRVPAGVTLEVVALDGGMSIIRTDKTDADGSFRIEGLPVHSMLMLRAIYKDANYHKQFRLDESGKARVEIQVFETTESTNDIRVDELQMIFLAVGEHLQAQETEIFSNETTPPRTFMDPSGNFRFSKAPAIESLPQIRITAPGASMPVVQTALESADGESYYSLYPLRPGRTTIDVFQILPYESRDYTYVKKFYYSIPATEIGVSPMDMEVTGTGLSKVRTDPEQNIAVYRIGSIKAGTEVEWKFSGGTPIPEQRTEAAAAESTIRSEPNAVRRLAGVIAPLLLLGFVGFLWYALNRSVDEHPKTSAAWKRQLKGRRDSLLKDMKDLDRRLERQAISSREYRRQQEEGKRMLHRISRMLEKFDKS